MTTCLSGKTIMRLNKLHSTLSLAAATMVSVISLGGCVEDRTTLFIAGVYSFAGETTCEVEVSLTANQLAAGFYDPGTGAPYQMYLLVANGIQPLGDNDTLRPETSRIVIEGAVIRVTESLGGAGVTEFTQNLGFVVNPDDSEDPGLAAVGIPAIPAGMGLPDNEYTIFVSVFGETLGGIDVESSEFAFPVTVQSGGALTCDSIDNIPEERLHPCGPGFLAQDGFIGTCDGNSSPVCGGC